MPRFVGPAARLLAPLPSFERRSLPLQDLIDQWCYELRYGGDYVRSPYGDISTWDVSEVTSLDDAFASWDCRRDNYDACYGPDGWYDGCYTFTSIKFGDISSWNVSKVTSFRNTFSGQANFTTDVADISGWDTSSGLDFHAMFESAYNFDGDLSGWNVSSATSLSAMFRQASSFNADISGWDASSGLDFYAMFQHASSFNQDLSGWTFNNQPSLEKMFFGASSFNQILCWNLAELGGSCLSAPLLLSQCHDFNSQRLFPQATLLGFLKEVAAAWILVANPNSHPTTLR